MEYVKIDDVNWTVSEVAKSATVEAFLAIHMSDEGTYSRYDETRKEAALRLVYTLCVPVSLTVEEVLEHVTHVEEKPKRKKQKEQPYLEGE